MSIDQDPAAVAPAAIVEKPSETTAAKEPASNGTAIPNSHNGAAPKISQDTTVASANDAGAEFSGDLDTNNDLPSQQVLKKVEDTLILDEFGKSRPFKNIYSGPNVARRVLVLFVRHFFCGNCQEYLKTLSENITNESLLSLPVPTSIAVIGCGAPSLIAQYRERTGCPFPIYADPTKKLYNDLGMSKTLEMGARPEYQRANNLKLIFRSLFQNLRQVPVGNALQGGDMRQVGGEFLFEPVSDVTTSPTIPSPINENGGELKESFSEEKRVTWCHRMKNTRDHAEVPELREVLGFADDGKPGKNERRWSKAIGSRKGSGLSTMGRQSLNAERPVLTGGAVPSATTAMAT